MPKSQPAAHEMQKCKIQQALGGVSWPQLLTCGYGCCTSTLDWNGPRQLPRGIQCGHYWRSTTCSFIGCEDVSVDLISGESDLQANLELANSAIKRVYSISSFFELITACGVAVTPNTQILHTDASRKRITLGRNEGGGSAQWQVDIIYITSWDNCKLQTHHICTASRQDGFPLFYVS
ncbi:hypothetical protein B0O99DRAFT_242029 [Bisporella sp. PMI_857]|nr:hypothetical protein B0O99DRAFT_242029 [Bisporella sp. PMI_857]